MAFNVQAQIRDRFAAKANADGGGVYFVAQGSAFPDSSVDLAAGTGAKAINKMYAATLPITAGATTAVDLTNLFYGGTTQAFSALKECKVVVQLTTTADTQPSVRFGPQGVANGAILFFGGTTGSVEVRSAFENRDPVRGWAVTSGNKVVQFLNNGSYTVNACVLFLGTG